MIGDRIEGCHQHVLERSSHCLRVRPTQIGTQDICGLRLALCMASAHATRLSAPLTFAVVLLTRVKRQGRALLLNEVRRVDLHWRSAMESLRLC